MDVEKGKDEHQNMRLRVVLYLVAPINDVAGSANLYQILGDRHHDELGISLKMAA
jgi:hypothetical protein